MRIFLVFAFLVTAIFISSCGTTPGMSVLLAKKEAAKLRPAYQRFQELCNSDDRVIIYSTAEVNGYLFADAPFGADCNSDGWEPLFRSGYKFYECSTGEFSNYESMLNGSIFRFYISNRNDTNCVYESDLINNKLSKYSSEYYANKNIVKAIRLYKGRLKDNQCLAKKVVGEPKSRYAKVLEFGYVDSSGDHKLGESGDVIKRDLIKFHGYSVVNIKTGKLLSIIDREYTYVPELGDNYIGDFKCSNKKSIDFNKVLMPTE